MKGNRRFERWPDGGDPTVPGGGRAADQPAEGEDRSASWVGEIRPRLVRLARRLLWNVDDAEEIAQEALALAWQRMRGLRDAKKRNAWLYRTTIHLSLNRRRKRRPSHLAAAEGIPGSSGEPITDMQTDETRDRLRQAMARLPDRQRAAVVLRELEGLGYDQIAAILKARPATVRVLVHRGREAMRETLLRRWPETFGPDR